jgi:DNA-binding MarR family transcriptional regulator
MGRRQPKPEPFSFEELEEIAQSPALQGFEQALQYRPILITPTAETVEDSTPSTVEDMSASTVEPELSSTVEADSSTTVVDGLASTVQSGGNSPPWQQLWVAEGAGGVFTSSRVKEIRQAQDALTHVEEAVYDALWGPKNTRTESYRLCQMGYTDLARRSRVSKRSIQSVIDRLSEKQFIRVETPPDISRRQSTVYRVLGYAAALKQMRDTGRNFVVRTGKGVFYASLLDALAPTVEDRPPSTVEDRSPSTVEATSTVTVEAASTSTVEATSTHIYLGNTEGRTSSSGNAVAARIVKLMPIDDDAVSSLIANCRRNDPKASDDEIGYCAELWIRENSRNTSIRKPVAVLLTAVPKFFQPPATELSRYREQKAREGEQSRELARAVLTDPESSDAEREWARALLNETVEQTEGQQREFNGLLEAQKRVLDDPDSSDEDKALARKILGL